MSLLIEDYSERAIALFGNTKPYKNTINELGGKYNTALKVPNSEDRRAGWIFPKSKRSIVQKLIEDIEAGKIEAEAVEEKKYEKYEKYEKKEYNKPTSSSTVEVSRTDFLNLLAKVERLEQEVNNLKLGKNSQASSSSSSKAISRNVELDDDEEENSEEEVKPKKGLLRRNKKD